MAGKEPTMSNKADYDPPEGVKPLKTWSYLSKSKRVPSEYEVVSTRLTYHRDDPKRPWNVGLNEPINVWYRKYGIDCPLKHDDWEAFRDPDEVTYRAYNTIQDGQENYVDGLLEHYAKLGDDKVYPEEWVKILAGLYAPGRYLLHAAQMASSYLFIIAPSSPIGLCSSFQAADQLRWVQRVAYRTVELANNRPGFGFNEAERQHWEEDAAWQGFRELMEKVLVTYDWGECFTSLCLVAKPAIDEAFFRQFGHVARSRQDTLLGLLAEAALRDGDRSRRWVGALVRFLQEKDGNQKHLDAWVAKWTPLADKAIDAFCAALPDGEAAAEAAKGETRNFRSGLGLGG
jgi:toluene monooxygenase system protein E